MANKQNAKNDLTGLQAPILSRLGAKHQLANKIDFCPVKIDFSRTLAVSRTAKKHKNLIQHGYSL